VVKSVCVLWQETIGSGYGLIIIMGCIFFYRLSKMWSVTTTSFGSFICEKVKESRQIVIESIDSNSDIAGNRIFWCRGLGFAHPVGLNGSTKSLWKCGAIIIALLLSSFCDFVSREIRHKRLRKNTFSLTINRASAKHQTSIEKDIPDCSCLLNLLFLGKFKKLLNHSLTCS